MTRFRSGTLGYKTTTVMLCTLQCVPIRGHMMSICPLARDVRLDHLVKVLSASFLHCRGTVFLFVINKYLWGRYNETMQVFCFSSYFLPTYFLAG